MWVYGIVFSFWWWLFKENDDRRRRSVRPPNYSIALLIWLAGDDP